LTFFSPPPLNWRRNESPKIFLLRAQGLPERSLKPYAYSGANITFARLSGGKEEEEKMREESSAEGLADYPQVSRAHHHTMREGEGRNPYVTGRTRPRGARVSGDDESQHEPRRRP